MANRKPIGVRWGKISEISHLRRIPTVPASQRTKVYAYDSLPKRLQELAAWRRMHNLREHPAIRQVARRQGVKPSSDLPLSKKVEFIRKRET